MNREKDYYIEESFVKTFHPRDESLEEWRIKQIKRMQRRLLRESIFVSICSMTLFGIAHFYIAIFGNFYCVNMAFVGGIYAGAAFNFFFRFRSNKAEEKLRQAEYHKLRERIRRGYENNEWISSLLRRQ